MDLIATFVDAVDATDPCNIIITRTWSLIDDNGNPAADQVQTITVQDNTDPTAMPGGGGGFPLDDSWIHLAFARNLAAGHGLSLNPGELVTGSTAPLWTALLSLVLLLPGSPVLWVKLFGVALHLVGVTRPTAWPAIWSCRLGSRPWRPA